MMPIYDNQTMSKARDESVIEASKGKILFIGSRGKRICEELVELNYSGLSLPTFSKAFYWLENQILSGAELPVAIISDYELSEGNVYSFYYKISSNRLLKLIPFIVIGDAKNREEKIKSLKIGIDDFYTDTVCAADINGRIQFLKEFKKLTAHLEPTTEINLSHFFPLFNMPILKRLIDILISGISLIVLSPLFMLISLLILLDSKGPVFYISKRAGTGFKIFDFYKFRTMRVNADQELESIKHLNQYDSNGNASFFKIVNDPRTTRLGKFLRSTFLDELPQMINVLKGDMSLVGNRPLPLYEAEKLTKDQWAKRFLAPAGITGLWQVTKRLKGGNLSEEERMELDITYAEKSSFVFDLMIMLLTIPALIHKESYK
jgi:lipopolysaccharide/colanic/teichoic acid biosynthesis glycosyltransferase